MFRRICNLCYMTETKTIRNLRKYTVTSKWETYLNIFSDTQDDKETTEKIINIPIDKNIMQPNEISNLNPIIVCKRKEFNFYPGTTYKKFDDIPIASKGWHHNKSKGDYFTINPIIENELEEDEEEECEFEDLNIDSRLIDNIKKRNIKVPTTIQKNGIPEILTGQNVIIKSETGHGKTLTYLLPIITKILRWKSEESEERPPNSPLAVIITPSQELALQIGQEAKILTKDLDIGIRTLVGGRTKKLKRNPAVQNIDILIGTLGVTCKLTAVHMYKLNYVRYTVIDEAHALFDCTFEDKMITFLRRINFGFKQPTTEVPHSSQLIMASATMPEQLPDYLNKSVDLDSIINVATHNCHRVLVPQKFMRLGKIQKPPTLLKLIKINIKQKIPTIVFSNSGSTCDWISIFLNQMGLSTVSLSGRMKMIYRKQQFRNFQIGNVNVLSTTNAGARGLNTVAADCIINYDFPLNTADYVHRCGRTGRIGSSLNGRVVNFISGPLEIELTKKIERAARRNRPLPMFNIAEQREEKKMDDEIKSLFETAKSAYT